MQYILNNKNNLLLLIVLLFSVDFFGLLPQKTALLLLPFCFYYFVVTLNKKLIFRRLIIIYIFFAFVSTISCYYYRGQSIFESISCPSFREYYFLFMYFIFCSFNPKIEIVEKMIIISFFIFLSLYIIQYIVYPTKIIEIIAGGSNKRFRVIGEIINSLTYFICLNRLFVKGGISNFIIIICCIFVIFILGFRVMVGALIFSSALMYIKINGLLSIKKNIITLISFCFIFIVVIQTEIIQNKLDRMLTANEEENFNNNDYIRILQLEYYMDDHFKSNFERLFGSGQPGENSSYGKQFILDGSLEAHIKGGNQDWGLLGQSWMVGPITIIIFFCMMFKCIKIAWKAGDNYTYISAWYIFLSLISLTNMEAHRMGSIVYHALIFYLVTKLGKLQETQIIENKHNAIKR